MSLQSRILLFSTVTNNLLLSSLQMVVPGPGEHPLQYNYTFWYSRRTPGRPASTQSYEQNIKQIGSFASVCCFHEFTERALVCHLSHSRYIQALLPYFPHIFKCQIFLKVEQFWRFYSHMIRPGDLTGHSDFHLFKEGIKPMWEVGAFSCFYLLVCFVCGDDLKPVWTYFACFRMMPIKWVESGSYV